MRRSRIARVRSDESRKKFGPNAISIVITRVVGFADDVPETCITAMPPTDVSAVVTGCPELGATTRIISFAGDVPPSKSPLTIIELPML